MTCFNYGDWNILPNNMTCFNFGDWNMQLSKGTAQESPGRFSSAAWAQPFGPSIGGIHQKGPLAPVW